MTRFFLQLGTFVRSVVVDFLDNKGFLLASALAYNALLSLIPLCVVLLVVLSLYFDQTQIAHIVRTELAFVVPGHAEWLTESIMSVVQQRSYVGGAVIVALLFFAGLAFRTFEDAMEVFFRRPAPDQRRHFLMSALIPYIFIVVLGAGVLALTVVTGVLDALAGRSFALFGATYSIAPLSGALLYAAGLLGLAGLFAALYKVMPVKTIQIRHALIGGATATIFWEIARRVLVWYFSTISVVNVVYGSLASAIVVLLTMEVACVILLLGAQVIAELDTNADADLPWHGRALQRDAPAASDGPAQD